MNHWAIRRINGTINIPAPTTGYTTVQLDFSSQIPTDITVYYHIINLGQHQLPYYEDNKITFVFNADYTNNILTIKSNTSSWNNYYYNILLFYKH